MLTPAGDQDSSAAFDFAISAETATTHLENIALRSDRTNASLRLALNLSIGWMALSSACDEASGSTAR